MNVLEQVCKTPATHQVHRILILCDRDGFANMKKFPPATPSLKPISSSTKKSPDIIGITCIFLPFTSFSVSTLTISKENYLFSYSVNDVTSNNILLKKKFEKLSTISSYNSSSVIQ